MRTSSCTRFSSVPGRGGRVRTLARHVTARGGGRCCRRGRLSVAVVASSAARGDDNYVGGSGGSSAPTSTSSSSSAAAAAALAASAEASSAAASEAAAAAAATTQRQQQQQGNSNSNSNSNNSSSDLVREFGFRPNFSERYELGSLIGAGSFATVHLATDRRTGQRFAVKTMPKRFMGGCLEPLFAARVRHEVDVYSTMGQSLNVAHLEAAFEDDVAVDLVLELCAGGTMWKRLRVGAYSERAAARLVRDMLRATAQCHAKGIVIRDVKLDNFLFLTQDEDSPLKMIDFGLAQFWRPGDPPLRDRAGTPAYVAPEVLKQSYGRQADVWSAGVAAYQLLTGRFPWHADPDYQDAAAEAAAAASGGGTGGGGGGGGVPNKQLFRAILSGHLDFEGDPWPALSPAAKGFVSSMLARDPSRRPSAAELLRHPWLAGLDDDDAPPQLASGDGGGGSSKEEQQDAAGLSSTSGTSNSDTTSSTTSSTSAPAAAASASLADTIVQRLQRFGTYGRLKQVALREVAHLMLRAPTDGALSDLAAAFSKLDPEGTGKVPFERAFAELRDGDYDLSDSEVKQLLWQFDTDDDGAIDLAEWGAALIDWRAVERAGGGRRWEGWVRRVFELFDADGSGTIGADELARALCGAPCGEEGDDDEEDNEVCVPDAVPAALRRVDADGDGRVSFEEFLQYLHTDDADELDLFPSRRQRKGAKRRALSVAEERRAASPTSGGGGGGVVEN